MDLSAAIQSLAHLKDQGLLTDEEFQAQKAKLLEQSLSAPPAPPPKPGTGPASEVQGGSAADAADAGARDPGVKPVKITTFAGIHLAAGVLNLLGFLMMLTMAGNGDLTFLAIVALLGTLTTGQLGVGVLLLSSPPRSHKLLTERNLRTLAMTAICMAVLSLLFRSPLGILVNAGVGIAALVLLNDPEVRHCMASLGKASSPPSS